MNVCVCVLRLSEMGSEAGVNECYLSKTQKRMFALAEDVGDEDGAFGSRLATFLL